MYIPLFVARYSAVYAATRYHRLLQQASDILAGLKTMKCFPFVSITTQYLMSAQMRLLFDLGSDLERIYP